MTPEQKREEIEDLKRLLGLEWKKFFTGILWISVPLFSFIYIRIIQIRVNPNELSIFLSIVSILFAFMIVGVNQIINGLTSNAVENEKFQNEVKLKLGLIFDQTIKEDPNNRKENSEVPLEKIQKKTSNSFLKNTISPTWNSITIFLLILIAVMGLSIVTTISSHSPYASQIAGPAIGGVIAAFAGIIFASWHDNENENKRKQFLARVFLSELQKYRNFIAGIEKDNIKSDDFLLTRPSLTTGDTIGRDPRPNYDINKYHILIHYLHDNPYIRTEYLSPLFPKKNPFEIFSEEMYSFEENNLISDLIKVEGLLNEASGYLSKYHDRLESESHEVDSSSLFDFMRRMERVKPVIDHILSEGKLESITNI
nr:hypothetical protein [uncultured Methanoregula sp.]